jgi:hypothetical protein
LRTVKSGGTKRPGSNTRSPTPWVAYRPVNGYRLFVRLREEFLDGRFDFIRHADE